MTRPILTNSTLFLVDFYFFFLFLTFSFSFSRWKHENILNSSTDWYPVVSENLEKIIHTRARTRTYTHIHAHIYMYVYERDREIYIWASTVHRACKLVVTRT